MNYMYVMSCADLSIKLLLSFHTYDYKDSSTSITNVNRHNFCIADVSRILDLIVYTSENHWPDFEHICCKIVKNIYQDTVLVDFRSATLISSISQSVSSFFAKLCSCLCSNEPDLNLLSHIN